MEAIKIIIKSNRQAKLNKRSISRMHTFPNLLKYSVSHACIYYSSVELCRLVRFICLWNNNRTPTEFEWKHNRSVDTVTEQRTRYTRNHGSIAGWYKKFHPSPKYPYRFCGSTSQLPGALFPGKKKKKHPRREADISPHRELRLIMRRIILNLPPYAYTACTGTDFNPYPSNVENKVSS